MEKVNVRDKFSLFDDHWHPRVVAELNGQYVKLAKLKGEFVWHRHADEDELFFVIKGRMTLELPDKKMELEEGELCVVPRGTDHRPVAENECHVLFFEPAGTLNTGDRENERTVRDLERI